MTRILPLILILVFTWGATYGQKTDSIPDDTEDFEYEFNPNDKSFATGWVSGHNTLDIFGGIFYCDFRNLNSKLKQQYSKTIEDRAYSIGLSWYHTFQFNRRFLFDGHFTYQFILPRKSNFSDSLTFKIQGYHLGVDFGKELFPKASHFDLYVGLGFNFGRFKLLRHDLQIDDKYLKYTNPFFAPKAVIEPRVLIGRLTISIKGEYLIDISNKNWNIKDSRLPTLGTSNSTGFFVQCGIGIEI